MPKFDDGFLSKAVSEVIATEERDRRARAKKRHDIYKDGGKNFLVEQIFREFSADAIREMRLTPVNFLKKVVNNLGSVYKRPPRRVCQNADDQALVSYYERSMNVNWLMQKANRYLVLASNTVIYLRPWLDKNGEWCIKAQVQPNYLYSLVAKPMDLTEIDAVIFSAFVEEGRVTPNQSVFPATGTSGYSMDRGYKTDGDVVESGEKSTDVNAQQFIFWSDEEHVTTNQAGARIMFPDKGEEQFLNPIEKMPIVNIARDRDNELWATQGEDMIDLTIALQMGWTDALTISKHQGFSQMVIVSEEKPERMTMGLNRALWLKAAPNGVVPSVSYVSPNSPINEYTEMLDKLTRLFLSTNNMDPGSIGGEAKTQTHSSGFHALISMMDSLEAVEADKPLMQKAESEFWDILSRWHNWMLENDLLMDEARDLGAFSEDFKVEVIYADAKPLESEEEKIKQIKELDSLGLITKKQALKKLHPELSDEQIDQMLEEIKAEKAENAAKAKEMFGMPESNQMESQENAVENGDKPEGVQVQFEEGASSGAI